MSRLRGRRGGGRSLLPLVCVLAIGAGGCCLFGPGLPSLARGERGKVQMDCSSRRRLELIDHTCRRDARNHMVVSLRFRNPSDKPYHARAQVVFCNAPGALEPHADVVDEHRFPPGESRLEWTSYRADAASYLVRLESARAFQW